MDAGTLGPNDGGFWCVLPSALNCSADLQPVQLTVTLTLNGQPFPAGTSTRGFVRFLDKDSEAPLSLAIPANGAATATATLLPGTYDVLYASGSPITGVPIGSVTLAAALVVSTTGPQTYDLKTAPISGTVTVNGSPFPNSTSQSRGDLFFREPNGSGVVAFPMGNTGPVAYSGHVFRTTYDVVLETLTPVFVKRTLASTVVIAATSIRTDDLVLSAVSGTLTLDGQTIPNSQFNRGSVEFYDPLTGAQIFAPIGMTGPAAYATQLPTGSYDVYLLTSDLAPAPLPRWARTKLASALTVNAPATLNWNTQSLDLTGTLTLDGQTFPIEAGTERGKLWLRDRAGNKDIFYTLPATGPATVNLRLFKGTYDIGYQGPNGPVTGLPRATRAPIALGTTLSSSTHLPMNLQTVLIDTSLTVDGQPRVTDEWYGTVFFTDHWGGTFGRGYPASGPAVEPMLAYKNVPYDVSVAVNPKVANPAVAQGQVVVRRDLKFLTSGPLALDAATISASGSITHNGVPLATSNVERGEVHLSNLVSGWHDKVLFGKTGPAVISTKVFSSPRDVSFIAAYDKYLPLALTGSPTFRIKRACLASYCRAMSNDVTGTWQLTVLGFYGNENRLQLVVAIR